MDVVADVATGAFATGGPPCSTVWAMPDDDTMLKQISAVLHQLCEHNKSHLGAACPTLFDSDAPPLLLPSVHCYLVRIHVITLILTLTFTLTLTLTLTTDPNPDPRPHHSHSPINLHPHPQPHFTLTPTLTRCASTATLSSVPTARCPLDHLTLPQP